MSLNTIRNSIKKPVVKSKDQLPATVLNLRQRKLNQHDPIGNPVFIQRRSGQTQVGSLENFAKKIIEKRIRIKKEPEYNPVEDQIKV